MLFVLAFFAGDLSAGVENRIVIAAGPEMYRAAGGALRHNTYASVVVPFPRFRKARRTTDPPVSIGDPRLDGWETAGTFADQATAVAWRNRLRELNIDACCVADAPLDRFGRGDIYLVVPPEQWSRANEIIENLE